MSSMFKLPVQAGQLPSPLSNQVFADAAQQTAARNRLLKMAGETPQQILGIPQSVVDASMGTPQVPWPEGQEPGRTISLAGMGCVNGLTPP